MFGYVRVYKPELKMAEYERYQAVYCSLCRELGKRYGLLARMTLSYDFTFLSLLLMAMDNECVEVRKGRCAFNPLKKCFYCQENAHLPFSADAATLLVYYKTKDNISDENFFRSLPSRLLLPFAALAHHKAAKKQPELDHLIRECINGQAAVERAGLASIDAAAEPFAQMLSSLLQVKAKEETQKRILNRFGYCLGRWIYLADAVDDLEEDLEQGSYNPYILSRGLHKGEQKELEETRQFALLTLNNCLAECLASYNLLTIHRYDGILRNILEWGIPAVQKRVITKKGINHER